MNRAQLREQIRRHADMVGSSFISDSELNALIDMTTRQLYDVLVAQYGDSYFAKVQWLNVNQIDQTAEGPTVAWPNLTLGTSLSKSVNQVVYSNTPADQYLPFGGAKSAFLLASDFLRLLRVEFVRGHVTVDTVEVPFDGDPELQYVPQYLVTTQDTCSIPIQRIDVAGQPMRRDPTDWSQHRVTYDLRWGRHRIVMRGHPLATWMDYTYTGAYIEFLPPPKGQYAVQLTYVPNAELLDNDTDEFHYPFPEYVIHGCAASCLEKQRSDSSVQRQLQSAVAESIVQKSRTADAANPPMVSMRGRQLPRRGEGFIPWE